MSDPHAIAMEGSLPATASPLVSVVIASYNMARYMALAVESALNQTYRNVEVLVIDDGSTDDTPAVIARFSVDDRVRYISQRNRGQAAAKNRGIRAARGDYIAFLDADDYWAPERLALQVPLLMQSNKTGVVYSRLRYIDEAGNESSISDNELFRGKVSGALFVRNFIAFGTSLVRRECFERMGGFDESLRMGIDYDLWLRISTEYDFDYIDRPLLYYRRWSGQMSNDTMARYLNGIQIMTRFLEKYPGLIDKQTQDEGWAHVYVGFGYCVWEAERSRGSGMRMFARALRYKPTYFPAWRALIAAALRL
jgi:glycosyltransferase involved in cell wall biosynthesis